MIEEEISKRVYCYKNLHKSLWSVRQNGKVICHCPKIFLKNVRFLVAKAGRQRVLREKSKNVHAGLSGYVCEYLVPPKETFKVTYNPYLYETFVNAENKESVFFADFAIMDINNGLTVWNE